MSMTYTPAEYADQVFHGKVCDKTVRNWIKNGKMPKGTSVTMTPTGYYLIHVQDKPLTKVQQLVEEMKAKAAA